MLRISVDATALRPKPSGIGWYVYHLINQLYLLQNTENFELSICWQPSVKKWLKRNLSAPEMLKSYSKVNLIPIPVTISNLLSSYPNNLLLNYFEKYFDSPDLIHGTDHVIYPHRKAYKVMTITDLTFIKYPDYVNSIVKTYTNRVKRCLQWTDLIITISESSKKDIIEYLDIEPNRIHVTPLASRYKLRQDSEIKGQSLASFDRYDFSIPYLLFVGTIEPRKNIINIIKAFNWLKQNHKIEHHLVMIGQKGWHYEPIFAAMANSPWANHIHHLDYLSDELVAFFYAQADLFVYPSHYEGFGLPVLEAMTLGTPVVTSNSSSLPEVAGDATLLIDPNEPIQIAEAILQVISDSQLRQNLIQKGYQRSQLFSWDKTARETLNAYRSLF